ncbi:Aste57867_22044 [Aphanomyces stellatus]|uniref:Acyltransferase n=1 Tax=Aphanomyces stellatus TaxID=120398 RepID=A0A485LJ82_9STRA|nr:hypothetical protein As57867_021975 [Aphanomyces stellatus]VFT98712.1 Aste57867_22044 [Aphanomyces stellatus]
MSVISIAAASIFVATLAISIQQWQFPLWQAILIATLLGYLPSYLEPSPKSPHGRYWPWWVSLDWRWVSPFQKDSKLHFEVPLAQDKQYLFAVHPHGMASWHHAILLAGTSTPSFNAIIPGEKRRHLGASVVFRVPFFREWLLFCGVVDASKHVANGVLRSGKSLVILVGGVIEQMMAMRGEHLVYVKNRKGHCKLAIQHGVPVVPAYCFGETDMLECSTFMLPFRQWVAKKYAVALPICWGPYWWCPVYPFDVEFNHVFGNPIATTKTAEPSQEEIDRVHQAYVDELQRIFDKYKAQFGYPKAKLQVV